MIRFILLLIIIVFATIGGYLWISRVSLLENSLSKRLNTNVKIEEVKIGIRHLTIENLRIENPAPAILPYAFEGDILIEVPLFSLWKSPLRIDQILLKNPTMTIELYNKIGSDNNWARILNRFPKNPGNRKFIIDKLMIENLQFVGVDTSRKSFSIPAIPYLEFVNLGNQNPLTLSQIGRIIFQSVLATLTSKQYLGGILDNVVLLPKNLLEGVESTLPLEKTPHIIQESIDTLKRKTQEATDFLQELFK